MSLQTQIQNLSTRIGTEFKTVRTEKANAVHTHVAADVTDFASAVGTTGSVTANTAKVSADGSVATHSDVVLTAISNGQILAWNTTNGRFEPVAPGGGGDLQAANNLSDVANVATARTNLSVDSSAEVTAKVNGVTLSGLGGLTQAEVDARAAISTATVTLSGLGGLTQSQVDARANVAVAAVVGGAPAALDTLNEIAAALNDDAGVVQGILAAQALRVRVDAAQGFSAPQLAQGQSNLNVVDAAAIGDTNTNYVTTFEAALI